MAKLEVQMGEASAIPSAAVSRQDCGVAGIGEPARLNHISNTVLSIVKFGGLASPVLRVSQWDISL